MHSQHLLSDQFENKDPQRSIGVILALIAAGMTAMIILAALYLASGGSGVFRMWINGLPAATLVQANILGGIVWLLSIFLLARGRSARKTEEDDG